MVKKEIDAGVIKKLRDEHVAFLPYVSDAKLRDLLRADIQALQTPEWNEKNYAEMLPRVVAEIWHSFSDRQVVAASNAEKVRRLELELELDRLKESGKQWIFDGRETSDFEYIWSRLDRFEPVEFALVRQPPGQPGQAVEVIETARFRVHLQNLVAKLDGIMGAEYVGHLLSGFFFRTLSEKLPKQGDGRKDISFRQSRQLDLSGELRMYGLLQTSQKTVPSSSFTQSPVSTTQFCLVFTEKMYRFKFWLAHHGRLSTEVKWECDTAKSPAA